MVDEVQIKGLFVVLGRKKIIMRFNQNERIGNKNKFLHFLSIPIK